MTGYFIISKMRIHYDVNHMDYIKLFFIF